MLNFQINGTTLLLDVFNGTVTWGEHLKFHFNDAIKLCDDHAERDPVMAAFSAWLRSHSGVVDMVQGAKCVTETHSEYIVTYHGGNTVRIPKRTFLDMYTGE